MSGVAGAKVQPTFNSGEWAPALYGRVDLAKYHTGAALIRNFYIDYRGGITTRPGTKYILPTKTTGPTRLIPFQASFAVSYVLEFGAGYIRFYTNGAPVVETAKNITNITNSGGLALFTSVGHGYANNDWLYITGVGGATQLNGNYYILQFVSANTYTLKDLYGNGVTFASLSPYTSGGQTQRVYTVTSPYQAADLANIKFAQTVNTLILCNPNYPPYQLVLTAPTNWSMTAITFGPTLNPPSSGLAFSSTLAAGSANYAYVVTSVDFNGVESGPSGFITGANLQDIRSVGGTNNLAWTAVTGAVYYNVYRAQISYNNPVPSGAPFGYIGYATGTAFRDSNITPDFSSPPPVPSNPFGGTGVQSVNLTFGSSGYSSVPNVTIAPPGTGTTAQASALCGYNSYSGNANSGIVDMSIAGGNFAYVVGTIFTMASGARLQVRGTFNAGDWILASGLIYFYNPANPGAFTVLNGPTNVAGVGAGLTITDTVVSVSPPVSYVNAWKTNPSFTINWSVVGLTLTNPGTGYTVAPAVTIPGGATATATLAGSVIGIANNLGNSTVPAIFQQRLWLAAPTTAPNQINGSVTGSFYNYNYSIISQPSDSVSGNIQANQLNTIKAMIGMPAGLLVMTDKQGYIINGGSAGSAITPAAFVANPQSYAGSSDLPPIVANADVLYVQAKGSIVRNLTYNFYNSVYTGADISVISSHLFYGYTIKEWCWAEEPFKVVYAVRSDGQMLLLTFQKEQELIAWSHGDTNGTFQSVCTVVENTTIGNVDAVYTIVQRTINGQTVQYVERFAEQNYDNNMTSAWQVDAGIQYTGSPANTFSGAMHLAGATVTGLADGIVIPPFVMPTTGTFQLANQASTVTVGLAFTAQLQTLPLDLGEPTANGKRKQITGVTVRTRNALNLQIGRTFQTLVPMKDLILGGLNEPGNFVVSNLVTGFARTVIDATWEVPGQYCIQLTDPYPASILSVTPEFVLGDTRQ